MVSTSKSCSWIVSSLTLPGKDCYALPWYSWLFVCCLLTGCMHHLWVWEDMKTMKLSGSFSLSNLSSSSPFLRFLVSSESICIDTAYKKLTFNPQTVPCWTSFPWPFRPAPHFFVLCFALTITHCVLLSTQTKEHTMGQAWEVHHHYLDMPLQCLDHRRRRGHWGTLFPPHEWCTAARSVCGSGTWCLLTESWKGRRSNHYHTHLRGCWEVLSAVRRPHGLLCQRFCSRQ